MNTVLTFHLLASYIRRLDLEIKHEGFHGFRNRGEARFLNHEDPITWLLTDLKDGSFTNFIWKCCKIDCGN